MAAASKDMLTGALRTAWKLRVQKNVKKTRKKQGAAAGSEVAGRKRGRL
jgi:hypothetical protein